MLSELKAAEISPKAEALTTAPVEADKPAATSAAEELTGAPADAGGEEQGDGKHTMVSHAALHEERTQRKQLAAELRAMREQQAQRDGYIAQQQQDFAIAQQRLAQMIAHREQAPPPDEQQDPLGAGLHLAKQTAAQVDAIRREQWQRQQADAQAQAQFAQRQQQEGQVNQLVQLTTQSERAFAASKPDYQEAITYAKNRRVKELVAAGYDADNAAAFAQREGWQLAHTWLSQGMNPAERGYAMAQAMGYTPRTVDDEERAEMREQGARASKPSGGGTARGRMGASQVANMTPTQLARMSDEDFQAAMGG